MMALWQYKQLTAGALAQTVVLEAGTWVQLVQKLVDRDFLMQEHSPQNERSIVISLAAAGDSLKQRARRVCPGGIRNTVLTSTAP